MAVTINGDGTITGVSAGGLPTGSVTADTLATNSVDSAELVNGAIDSGHLASGVGDVQTKAVQLGFNTATATGSVSITGVGFQPKSYACTACWGVADNNITHAIGDGTDNHMHLMKGDGTAGHWALSSDTLVAYPWISSSNRGTFTFTSFDAGGMTMAWTKIGSPTGTFYLNIIFHG